ncbi:hypothetical protein FHS63_006163 [Azospirillum doebereinerae]
MARTRNLVTMERVAEILGEDVEWLIEPPRVCRRPIWLSHAAMATSSI